VSSLFQSGTADFLRPKSMLNVLHKQDFGLQAVFKIKCVVFYVNLSNALNNNVRLENQTRFS
jgi:hypothetical protein